MKKLQTLLDEYQKCQLKVLGIEKEVRDLWDQVEQTREDAFKQRSSFIKRRSTLIHDRLAPACQKRNITLSKIEEHLNEIAKSTFETRAPWNA